MIKRRFTFSLAVLMLLAVISLIPALGPARAQAAPGLAAVAGRNWEVPGGVPAKAIRSREAVALKNLTTNTCLIYKTREYGINLDWSSRCQPTIKFTLKHAGTPIRYGDPVAIWVEGGGYLHYQARKYGINLVWSSRPIYEWEIRGGNTQEIVREGAILALYNQVEQDYVMYCQREYGINLRWLNDC